MPAEHIQGKQSLNIEDNRLIISSKIFNKKGDSDLRNPQFYKYNLTWSISLPAGEEYDLLINKIRCVFKNTLKSDAVLLDRSSIYPPKTGSLFNIFAKDAITLYKVAKTILVNVDNLYTDKENDLFSLTRFEIEAKKKEQEINNLG